MREGYRIGLQPQLGEWGQDQRVWVWIRWTGQEQRRSLWKEKVSRASKQVSKSKSPVHPFSPTQRVVYGRTKREITEDVGRALLLQCRYRRRPASIRYHHSSSPRSLNPLYPHSNSSQPDFPPLQRFSSSKTDSESSNPSSRNSSQTRKKGRTSSSLAPTMGFGRRAATSCGLCMLGSEKSSLGFYLMHRSGRRSRGGTKKSGRGGVGKDGAGMSLLDYKHRRRKPVTKACGDRNYITRRKGTGLLRESIPTLCWTRQVPSCRHPSPAYLPHSNRIHSTRP